MIPLKSVPLTSSRSAPPQPTDPGWLERRAYRQMLLRCWAAKSISRADMIAGIVRLKQASTHRRRMSEL